MSKEISNTADIIDVRDIIERFEELETELQDRHEIGEFVSDFDDWIDNCRENSDPIHAAFGEEGRSVQTDIEEFYKLREFLKELCGSGGDEQWRGDWYPVTLIRDSYFTDYARELAEDCGMIQDNASWPNNCIDWDMAASELQWDYSSMDFDGVTYWYR